MSKSRNRSVKTLPHGYLSFLESYNKNTKNQNHVNCFGENIKNANDISPYLYIFSEQAPCPQTFTTTSNSDIDSITVDLNKLSGLSSSSSLSWSDEYESETTKKVQEELEKMDKIFRGEEPIPEYYDKDEYEQWMDTFPHLTIFDTQVTPVNSTTDIFTKLLKDQGQELNFNGIGKNTVLGKNCDIKEDIGKKYTVIDFSKNSANILLNRSANTARKRKLEDSKNNTRSFLTLSHKLKNLDTEKYLKISSLQSKIYDRKNSSKSLLNRQISKECLNIYPGFTSLPYIKIDETDYSKKGRTLNGKISNKQTFQQKVENNLILPPIVNPNQFRSISATPRQSHKTFSALSLKFVPKFREEKMKSTCFLESPASNW